MELFDGSANPRPSRPVRHRPRHRRECSVRSRHAELPRDSRELGGEEERLDSAVAPRHGVCEVQEHARIALHGTAHVAQEHERPWAHASCPSRQLHHIAAGAEAFGDRASKIDPRATPPNPPPRSAFARIPDETRQRGARLDYFVRRERAEVLVGKGAKVAPGLQAFFRRRRVALCLVDSRGCVELLGCEDVLDLDPGNARLVGRRAASDLSVVVCAPEGCERPVEDRDLFLAMDEERTACVIHLVACAEIHMPECLNDVQ